MQFQELVPWLLVAGVLSLMIAPVMWMQPSPRQKRLAGLRQAAIALGMHPQLRPVPAELKPVHEGQLMTYVLQRQQRERNPAPRRYWYRESNLWLGKGAVPDVLEELPVGVLAVEIADNAARVYWLEAGTEQDLKRIKQVLQGLLEPTVSRN